MAGNERAVGPQKSVCVCGAKEIEGASSKGPAKKRKIKVYTLARRWMSSVTDNLTIE